MLDNVTVFSLTSGHYKHLLTGVGSVKIKLSFNGPNFTENVSSPVPKLDDLLINVLKVRYLYPIKKNWSHR